MLKKFQTVCLLSIIYCTGFSQQHLYTLTTLNLNNLEDFAKPPGNWTISGPLTASYTDTAFAHKAGTGVLLNQFTRSILYNPSANLITRMEHSDIYLEMDVMMARGSNSGIYLQGRYEVQLMDSWGKAYPGYGDMGGIYERWDETRPDGKKGFEGHAPLVNAALAPGLWQHLEIQFQAPRFDAAGKKTQDAKFLKVVLNGVTLHENIVLHGPTRSDIIREEVAKGPVIIQGDHGYVAFRNIRYAPLEDLRVSITDLNYTYAEGAHEEKQKFTSKDIVRTGKAEEIDGRLAEARDNFLLEFTGTMDLPATDTYQFLMQLSGMGSLVIDGKPVIPAQWTWVGGNLLKGSATLSAGKHSFQLSCHKHVNWAPAGLGLFVSKPNSKPVSLHTSSSLPERPPAPLLVLDAGKEPTLLRSFWMHEGKKVTHSIAVGEASGVHYAYNLRQAALMNAWKGAFLNTTEMWHERGEPQTAEPMGAGPKIDGLCFLAGDKNQVSDTVSYSKLIYKGYALNDRRRPVFSYQYQQSVITDLLAPSNDGRGLTRTITVSASPLPAGTVFRLASGKEIRELGNGLYVIGDQQYYLNWQGTDAKPYIHQHNGKAYLLVDAATVKSIQYSITW